MDQKLPIEKIFITALKLPFQNRIELVKLSWPYIGLSLASSFLVFNSSKWSILYLIITYIFGLMAAVRCHRVFLYSTEKLVNEKTFKWTKAETNYLFKLILVSILIAIIFIPFYFVTFKFSPSSIEESESFFNWSYLLYITLSIPAHYVFSRIALILPAAAVGQDKSLKWSWKVTSSNPLRIAILLGAIPLIVGSLINFIFSKVGYNNLTDFLVNITWLLFAIIELCLLSLSFKWFIQQTRESN